VLRPTKENLDWRVLRVSKGLGRLLAADRLAVVPSLLPSRTDQEGPPAYMLPEANYMFSFLLIKNSKGHNSILNMRQMQRYLLG